MTILTLPQEPGEGEDYVWGVAYRIHPDHEEEVRAYLGASSPWCLFA